MKTRFILMILVSVASFAQQDLNVEYKLRATIYASTSIEDTSALGGFGVSDNRPKPVKERFREKGFFLKINPDEHVVIAGKFNGFKLYIVNASDSIAGIVASDSRLPVVAQAFIDNTWQDIEYLPSSWCGNSYHKVSLKPGEFWEFDVPRFAGAIKTTLRYKITLNDGKELYSNLVKAGINRKQLTEKQGHSPQGLMDPYNE